MLSESAKPNLGELLRQKILRTWSLRLALRTALLIFVSTVACLVSNSLFAADDGSIPYTVNTQNVPMTFERVQRCAPMQSELRSDLRTDVATNSKCLNIPQELGSGPIILAQGTIGLHSSDTLAQITPEWPQGSIVAFQSLGGDLMGGLRLGQYVRARSFYTFVPNAVIGKDGPLPSNDSGKCFSACAYSFLGGVARRVNEKALYGVHQFRAQESGLDSVQTQKISAVLAKYMDAMNVSRLLLDQAMLTDPGKVNIVNDSLRRSWRVEASLDYTAQQALPKWRLEVSSTGNRLAFTSRKQLNSAAVMTIALTPINGQMRLLLIVKPDPSQEGNPSWLDYFLKEVSLQVQDGSKVHILQPITGWGKAGNVNTAGTKQIWFAINDELIQELKNTTKFTVKPLWTDLPKGLDVENVFGTEGLQENLAGL